MENLNSIITLQKLFKGRNVDFDSTQDSAIQLIRHADNRVGKDEKLLIAGTPVPSGVSNLYKLYIYHRD